MALERQAKSDLLWIREEFLPSKRNHGAVVVHGHSECEAGVQMRSNRIGVDTAAHRSGMLSAVGLEGDRRWPLIARGRPGPLPGRDHPSQMDANHTRSGTGTL